MNIIFQLINKLIQQGIKLNKPATWQQILAFEYKFQVKLSAILSTYSLELNGFVVFYIFVAGRIPISRKYFKLL